MDFMKILDQTVREIKREVNLKVLKVPEIEQKVLDATSDEPWGPHGSALSEIAQATKKFTECQIIMSVLWIRLTETDANWRHVYKALAVIEYLVANGSERALDEILDRSHRIAALSDFQCVDTNGKDVGINVRKKVETILALLNDKEKINQVREKAASNRDKYFGLSSTGITYKSTSGSQGGISIDHNDGNRGVSSGKGDSSIKGSYKERARYEGDSEKAHETRESPKNSQKNKSKKGVRNHARSADSQQSSSSKSLVTPVMDPPPSASTESKISEDDFDDFDPRGTSAGRANLNTVDLFGQSVVADLMDLPPPCSVEANNMKSELEVDLFSDATFVSAPPTAGSSTTLQTQGNIDMFASKPDTHAATDFFVTSKPVNSETKSSDSVPTNNENFDPFAAIPLNNFAQSDQFGDFTSNATSERSPPTQDTSGSQLQASGQTTSSTAKKDTFHVKSSIWADSLSRGLIDLNITAPKKTSLADIGILGGLDDGSDEKDKVLPTSTFMSRAMGPGSGWGTAGFSSSSMVTGNGQATAGLGQHQFGSFK